MTQLGPRFEQAIILASRLHAGQKRKGTSIPYLAHLLGVCSLVLEMGGDEDEAIAALLHDAVEDQGGLKTLAEIKAQFGDQVADIVLGVSDSYSRPKPPWRERKKAYLQHLAHSTPSERLVSIADKVHNARSIVADLRTENTDIWDRFRGGRDGTLWYYRSLARVFLDLDNHRLVDELGHLVQEMERLA